MKKSKVVLFIILVTTNLLLLPNQIQEVLSIQIFLFTVVVLWDWFHKKISNNKHIAPSYFLVINFLRIFICVLFLLPKILNYSKNENTYIYNFFIIYFIYIFSDIILKTKIKN